MSIQVREIRVEDASSFLMLCTRLDEESSFMMLEPGERNVTVEEQQQQIATVLAQTNSTTLAADADGALVGYVAACGGEFRRNRHTAYIVAGVLHSFAGQGLGTTLFGALIDWARGHGVTRLELTVMGHNASGIALYRKVGFVEEGVRQRSIQVNGVFVDEIAMALLLDPS